MCGRFTLTRNLDAIADTFGTGIAPGLSDHEPRYNIAPTEEAPVVIAVPGGRRAGPMRWGLVPAWARDVRIGGRLINARCETVGTRNAFRESFVARRCLVPADGFYEWEARRAERPGEKPRVRKQPYWIHRPGAALFAMAGIWALWSSGPDSRLATFSVLTRDAPDPIRWLHDRVPVILPEDRWTDWLARGTPPEALGDILGSADPPELQLHPVSRAVNRAGYDAPDCIREVTPG